DSVSQLASLYAIPNEYDKMLSIIGAKGTNAYTWVEQTVYTNDIPSNQLETWLKIEAERFRNPIMRLFHTELETVYEEKNISLDDDGNKAWEALFANLFPTHQYGTQTTIGTIEDLKNPSIRKVIEYYKTYYVSNNMAICLSGDLDPERTIELIDKYWGNKQPSPVPEFIPSVEKPITKPVEKEVFGRDAEFLYIGFRFPGAGSREADLVKMIDMILANSKAGLLDINLNQKQKVLSSGSFLVDMKDYTAHVLSGNPREGQSLEDVKKLILEQIELLKKGEFPDWLLQAVVNDMKLNEIKQLESNRSRAHIFVDAFVRDIPWEKEVELTERLSKITKEDIVKFANENYGNNYVVVYKRTGEDKNSKHVEKPLITPLEVNREDKSDFLKSIESLKPEEISPEFLDYSKEIRFEQLKNNVPLLYRKNQENGFFTISFTVDMGSNHNKKIPLATSYFDYLGTSKYSASELKQEFYKIGCTYSLSSDYESVNLTISGLNENFLKAVELTEELLTDIQPDDQALRNLVNDILKIRADNKLNKDVILWDAMFSYGKYGPRSPFKNILSESELKSLKASELTELIKELLTYRHRVTYYGPEDLDKIIDILNRLHVKENTGLKELPEAEKFDEIPTEQNQVIVVDYPDMVQAEILLMSRKGLFNKEMVPYINIFNEYFGSGMSGIVFQEIRESKALAYSTFASFTIPKRKDQYHYNIAYLGTQSDKLEEALTAILSLLENMPESEASFNAAKKQLIEKINTERITKSSIISSYLNAEKLGINYDIRKDVYEAVKTITIDQLSSFHRENVKNSKHTFLILGDTSKLKISALEKLGKVQFVSLEELFGY
ncbi:MAG: insulinase family protein, partial [Ignavibacteria bacterium]|nr:insulinase family protein [Ignavibacteria bacterium]